jgi:methionine-gamma-lyase
MRGAAESAERVAMYLARHTRVARVYFPTFLPADSPARKVFEAQCSAAGSTFSFDIVGGEKEAFAFLNRLEIFKLAVSLGGTESLICHPASTVHSGLVEADRKSIGITDALIRLSIGIEHPDDLIADLEQAFGG